MLSYGALILDCAVNLAVSTKACQLLCPYTYLPWDCLASPKKGQGRLDKVEVLANLRVHSTDGILTSKSKLKLIKQNYILFRPTILEVYEGFCH